MTDAAQVATHPTPPSGPQSRPPPPKRRPAARAARKADVVAHDLLTRVVAGDIAVGSLLPRENELAEQYGVNRGVVREAVKLLEVHRIVQPTRRRGTEVLDPIRSLTPEVLRAMLRPRDGRIDARMLECLLEIRAALDIQMTTLAASRRSDADLSALDALVRELEHDPGDDVIDRVRRELPVLIARATGNPLFEMLAHWNDTVVRDLEDLFRWVRPARAAYVQGIALLVDLIRRREVDAIHSLVTTFHGWSTPRLLAAASIASGEPLPAVVSKEV
jgi:GntR family transcriptional repressor for pyruvate dehydrogenase complex